MNALFLADPGRARRAAARFFGDNRPRTDGPFRYLPGSIDGEELRIYIVEGGTDASYAAARIAARRGATRLIPFLDVAVEAGAAQRLGISPGDVLPIQRIWDAAPLTPLLRLLPESAVQFPIPVAPLLPAFPVWETGADGLGVATLPFRSGNQALARLLDDKLGTPLFDLQAAGFAEGARDAGADLLPLGFVTALLGPAGRRSSSTLDIEARFEEALADALKKPA